MSDKAEAQPGLVISSIKYADAADEPSVNEPKVADEHIDVPRISVSSWRLPTVGVNHDASPRAYMSAKSNLHVSPMNKLRKHDTDVQDVSVNIHRSSAQLIDEHLQEIQVRADGHAKAALRYEKRDRILGYPVTLMSSFLASTLMMGLTQNNSNNPAISYASLGLSVASFVLSLSRDYLKYTHLFQAHDISSKLYTNLLRSIEVRLIGNHITTDERRDMFKDIIDQMSIIEQYEHAIPSDINFKVRSEMFVPRSVVINKTLLQESDRKK